MLLCVWLSLTDLISVLQIRLSVTCTLAKSFRKLYVYFVLVFCSHLMEEAQDGSSYPAGQQ